jgi:hypothetical protein
MEIYEIYVGVRASQFARTLTFDATGKVRATEEFGRSSTRLPGGAGRPTPDFRLSVCALDRMGTSNHAIAVNAPIRRVTRSAAADIDRKELEPKPSEGGTRVARKVVDDRDDSLRKTCITTCIIAPKKNFICLYPYSLRNYESSKLHMRSHIYGGAIENRGIAAGEFAVARADPSVRMPGKPSRG